MHADSDALEIGSHLWMRPYLVLHPSACFVLARPSAGDGSPEASVAVGYLLLAPSTKQHYQRIADEYLPTLPQSTGDKVDEARKTSELATSLLKLLHSPLVDLANLEAKYPGLLERYPAHLHIDILPEYQARGWGRKLIEMAMQYLVVQEIGGVHLLMAEGNTRARKFYEERCLFTRWKEEGEGEWVMWRELGRGKD